MIATRTVTRRHDLPLGRDASGRLLPWIIALMVYLSGLGGVGLLLLGDTLHDWNRTLDTLTLQVPGDISAARLEVVVALLRQTRGIASVHPLAADEAARLVGPWLGPPVPVAPSPLPRLVDFRTDPGAKVDFTDLRQKLASIVPGATLDDHRLSWARLRGLTVQVERVIAAIVAVVAALLVLTVVFTARTGLAIHQPVVELLYLLGAPDRYIAHQFQSHALSLGLRGGVIGAAAAALTVVILRRAGGALRFPLPIVLADWRVWGLLAAAALGAALVVTITARATISRRLARMP